MPNNFGNDNEVRCSFCGKPQSQAKRLISGNGVYICDECVELCMDIIADEDSLHRGRPQPKNCRVSQSKKLFDLDKVDLEFTPEALDAIAEKTIARKTGARGLRSIMEDTLKNLMFEVPSDYTIEKITVTKDSVENGAAPEIVHNPDRVPVKIKMTQPKRRARKDSAS